MGKGQGKTPTKQRRGDRGESSQTRRQHTSRQVLLVCKHEEQAFLHLPIAQNPMQLLFRFVYPLPILAVHDEDETLRSGVIMSPQRSNLVLSTDIPNVELYVLVGHCLDIETD
jgi:hypothetical protein